MMDEDDLLQQALEESFTIDELNQICFELDIDFENIPGTTKTDKTRELILYLQRRKRLNQLKYLCNKKRPNVDWNGLFKKFASERTWGFKERNSMIFGSSVLVIIIAVFVGFVLGNISGLITAGIGGAIIISVIYFFIMLFDDAN